MQSLDVQAFRNVENELFSSSTNGSFTGYFSDPHKTECSMMWATPVSSSGIVRNTIANVLLSSSRSSHARSAPFFSYVIRTSRPFTSGSSVTDLTVKPWSEAPGTSGAISPPTMPHASEHPTKTFIVIFFLVVMCEF